MNKKCKETQHNEKGEKYVKKEEPSISASVSMHSEGTGHDGDAKLILYTPRKLSYIFSQKFDLQKEKRPY